MGAFVKNMLMSDENYGSGTHGSENQNRKV
jgi:hypothetical protein